MSDATMLVELGNGWELQVRIEVVEYCPGYAGSRWEPGEPEWVEFGQITADGEFEELGIKDGQVIHPAYLTETLDELERRAIRERAREIEYAKADAYDPDAYDRYYDR